MKLSRANLRMLFSQFSWVVHLICILIFRSSWSRRLFFLQWKETSKCRKKDAVKLKPSACIEYWIMFLIEILGLTVLCEMIRNETKWYFAKWYFPKWYFAKWYFPKLYFAKWYFAKWYFAKWYFPKWFFAKWYFPKWFFAKWYFAKWLTVRSVAKQRNFKAMQKSRAFKGKRKEKSNNNNNNKVYLNCKKIRTYCKSVPESSRICKLVANYKASLVSNRNGLVFVSHERNFTLRTPRLVNMKWCQKNVKWKFRFPVTITKTKSTERPTIIISLLSRIRC